MSITLSVPKVPRPPPNSDETKNSPKIQSPLKPEGWQRSTTSLLPFEFSLWSQWRISICSYLWQSCFSDTLMIWAFCIYELTQRVFLLIFLTFTLTKFGSDENFSLALGELVEGKRQSFQSCIPCDSFFSKTWWFRVGSSHPTSVLLFHHLILLFFHYGSAGPRQEQATCFLVAFQLSQG